MTAVLLQPIATTVTGSSAAAIVPKSSAATTEIGSSGVMVDTVTPADPFDIDLTIVTEIDADLLPKACGTGDGCKPSCASSCASAV
ncbi:FxLD family lanthipeptide [Streptomyces griseoruber]